MRWKIHICRNCNEYTLQEKCRNCGAETSIPHPPRFSPEDKYLKYKICK